MYIRFLAVFHNSRSSHLHCGTKFLGLQCPSSPAYQRLPPESLRANIDVCRI